VSAREFPSSAEEGWPRHQEENSAATFDGADGVVLVKRMHDFLTKPPRLRGCGRFAAFLLRAATPPQLRRGVAITKRFVNWTAVPPLRRGTPHAGLHLLPAEDYDTAVCISVGFRFYASPSPFSSY
jgi:hypothetical protein